MNRAILDVEAIPATNERGRGVYDVGVEIVDGAFNVLESRRYIVRDTFYGMSDEMSSAYYKDKLPGYHEDIHMGRVLVKTLAEIRAEMLEMFKAYKIREVWAYNAIYDEGALNETADLISRGLLPKFFPDNIKICCIHHLAAQMLFTRPDYYRFALRNKLYKEETGNMKTGAEQAYAYIIDDPAYEEKHTALEDVKIERQILQYCLKKRGKKNKQPNGSAWKIPQAGWQEHCINAGAPIQFKERYYN